MSKVDEIAGLLASNTSTDRGRAQFLLLQSRKSGRSPSTTRLLEEIASREASGAHIPAHPEQHATREQYRRDKDVDLSPVELAWLQRLPLDPAQVTFEQAARLAAFSSTVSQMKAPASARLIESIWAPVKELHDRRVAEARAQAARQSPPSIPATAEDALAEALSEQYPDLGQDAVRAQARQIITQVADQATERHASGIRTAERDLSEVEAASRQRQALDREEASA